MKWMRMKYTTYAFMIFLSVASACNLRRENQVKKDTAQNIAIQKEAATGDNMVKSEAPDAVDKLIQGYALPKFDDGLAQSPINILSNTTVQDTGQFISTNSIPA